MAKHPAIMVPVEITSENNEIRFSRSLLPGSFIGSVEVGIYRSPGEVFAALRGAVLGASNGAVTYGGEGGDFAARLTPDGQRYELSFFGFVGLAHVVWDFSATTEALAKILGRESHGEGFEAGEWRPGTRSPTGWWTSDMPAAVDEGDYPDEEVVQTRALSGYRQTSILSPVRYLREVRIDLLEARHVWRRAEVIPGESFESTVWPHRHEIRYFSDRNDPDSGADYVITEPLGQFRPPRWSDREDVARYVLRLEMERLVGGGG